MESSTTVLMKLGLGTSGLVSALSASTLLLNSIPKLSDLASQSNHADLYEDFVRKPILTHLFGADFNLPWASHYFDAFALWLSLFAAVNVFIYRNEGVFLWSHIRRNYCGLSGIQGAGFCAFWKTLFAFAATPIACAHIALMSLFSKRQTLFTSAYITLDPDELASYLKHLGMATTALLIFITLVTRLI